MKLSLPLQYFHESIASPDGILRKPHIQCLSNPQFLKVRYVLVRFHPVFIHCCASDAIVVSFSEGTDHLREDVLWFLPKKITSEIDYSSIEVYSTIHKETLPLKIDKFLDFHLSQYNHFKDAMHGTIGYYSQTLTGKKK